MWDFNSIKVRLKPALSKHRIHPAYHSFQFHKGTIKTETELRDKFRKLLFQFHKGTIKTTLSFISFLIACLFQFHKGTIKTQ